jgi:hypothetical protein
MILNNWSVVSDPDPYLAPELRTRCLQGIVYGHPLHHEGTRITTSPIVSIDPFEETITTKSGSVYCLGFVDPKYEAQFLGARGRFFGQT